MNRRLTAVQRCDSTTRASRIPVLLGGVLLALLALACGPAEEPTATTAPEPTATSAPESAGAEEPTPTSAPAQPGEPTATPQPTSTPGGSERPGTVTGTGRPEITPEIIERLPKMTVSEVLNTFPASYPKDYQDSDVQMGGTFRAAVTWDISKWDPRLTTAGGTMTVSNIVYERLVEYQQGPGRDPVQPAIVSDLAEAWEYNEDGTQLRFKLREGVHWGNPDSPLDRAGNPGPEITAEDMEFIYAEYRDNSVYGGIFKTLERVEVVDKYTFIMHFSTPTFYLLPFLASKDGVTFNPHLARADRMDLEIVGPGSFMMTEAKKSQFVELKRNPDYFMRDSLGRQLPYLDEVRLIIAPEQTTRVALFRTHRVEYSAGIAGIARDLQAILRTNPDMQVFANPGASCCSTVSFQMNDPLWQDVRARRAFTLAIDNKGIVDVVLNGWGTPMDGKFYWWHYSDNQPTWDPQDIQALFGDYQNHYDLERAKDLWSQTGIGEVTLAVPFYAYRGDIADQLALWVDDARKLGIRLKPQSQDYSDYNSTLQAADYSGVIWSWGYPGYSAQGMALNKIHSQGAGNRENMNDPQIDELVEQLSRTNDPAEKRSIITRIRERYNEQVYWAPFNGSWTAISLGNFYQPEVRGMRGGQNAGFQYYYAGPKLRIAWLDKAR